MSQLKFIENAAETTRYHTWPVLRRQNIGDHSYKVAMLCSFIVGREEITAALLMAALTHDLAEHVMGDLPAPVKRSLPNMVDGKSGELKEFRNVWDGIEEYTLAGVGLDWNKTLTAYEHHVLKLADAADGCLYCIRERSMGNKLITSVWANYHRYFLEVANYESAKERELGKYIAAGWDNAIR